MTLPIDWPLLGMGALMVVLGLPAWMRLVPPNPLIGLRVPATDADDWVWYEANAASGRDLVLLGVLLILLSVVLPGFFRLPEATWSTVRVSVMLPSVLVVAVVGWWRANRLLRHRQHLDEIERQILKEEREGPADF